MFNTIGESVVRTTTRADNNLALENRDVSLEKTEKVVEERPVENSEESAKSETEGDRKPSGYDVDDKGVYFEKYDKKGNVIYRIPPEQKPIDELA
ncbi:hypothetical protein [uncultured Desulfosarcina sp.]|uniref:hypothetical protein n=1 Tax=uncultured Desulfosarcina sp. TaxID=218289 RepID=UPI0029C8DE98|nr:hypothetical protein [uncultured Desulfosarcina sp.]